MGRDWERTRLSRETSGYYIGFRGPPGLLYLPGPGTRADAAAKGGASGAAASTAREPSPSVRSAWRESGTVNQNALALETTVVRSQSLSFPAFPFLFTLRQPRRMHHFNDVSGSSGLEFLVPGL